MAIAETEPRIETIPLVDGHAKVTGHLRFVADLKLPNMLDAHIVASEYAHARIISIQKEEALAVPGVVAVLTADDLPDMVPSSRGRLLLARDRVIFYGQPVALVIAKSEYAAADGAEKVIVNYDPLPAAVNIHDAMAADAPLVWENGVPGTGNDDAGAHGADVSASTQETKNQHSNVTDSTSLGQGDVEAAFASADHIVEHTFRTPVVHQNSIETHGMFAQPNPMTGGLTIWSSTQAPFDLRADIAELLDIPESDVRVVATPVGGGFGGKFGLYEPLIALAAHTLGKPIRLILTRMNELAATNPAPLMEIQARMAADSNGNLTALDAHIIVDSGCFPTWITGFCANAMMMFYRIPNYRITANTVMTFKPSIGAYRAPTAPVVIFVLDTLIDELASQLNIDSIDLRLKHCILPGDPLPSGQKMPSIGMRETLQAVKQHPLWQNREESRKQGRGIGVAVGGWMGGVEPGAAICKLNRDGTVQIQLGTVDLSGTTTTFSLIAAESFGVSLDKVRIIYSDTDHAPYTGSTAGSKLTYSMAKAIAQAAESARQQTLELASELFEASVDDLEIVNDKVQVRGVPNKTLELGEIAAKTMHYGSQYAPIFAHGRAAMETSAPGFNAQIVEVEVDEETGFVQVLKHVAIQDVGKALNPTAIEGQMMGGGVQGLGWALYEGMLYDDMSGQLLTGTYMDYNLPSAVQAGQSFEAIILEVPSDIGYMGMRGVGEPPVIATAAAVANAIAHATGVRLSSLPMRPLDVLTAINAQNQ